MGDPRSWGDEPEAYDRVLAEHGVEPLPDPPIDFPEWLQDLRTHWAGRGRARQRVSADGRTPLLVGVGIVGGDGETEAVELMATATRSAVVDAGAPGIARAIEQIAVPKGNWSYPDPARLVAERVGTSGARTLLFDLGIPQQTLINHALQAIRGRMRRRARRRR